MAAPRQTLERLTMFSDGILAVVATLLVLGIEVPEEHRFSEEGLLSFLAKIRHDVGAYAVSFLIICSYWIEHHVICLYLQAANRVFTWLNFVFLFFATLIPFATKLLAVYRQEFFVVLLYGLLQVACGVSLALLWWYANTHPRLLAMQVDDQVRRSLSIRILLGPLVNLAAVGASYFYVPLAVALFVGAPLLNLSHRRVDANLRELPTKG